MFVNYCFGLALNRINTTLHNTFTRTATTTTTDETKIESKRRKKKKRKSDFRRKEQALELKMRNEHDNNRRIL